MTGNNDLLAKAEQLKAGINLPTIIGGTVPLKRLGKDLAGCCPFHGEKTPSFVVYRDHFHCFGCGAHGDAFDWCAKIYGLKFPLAVAYLGGGDYVRVPALEPSVPEVTAPASDNSEAARRLWM